MPTFASIKFLYAQFHSLYNKTSGVSCCCLFKIWYSIHRIFRTYSSTNSFDSFFEQNNICIGQTQFRTWKSCECVCVHERLCVCVLVYHHFLVYVSLQSIAFDNQAAVRSFCYSWIARKQKRQRREREKKKLTNKKWSQNCVCVCVFSLYGWQTFFSPIHGCFLILNEFSCLEIFRKKKTLLKISISDWRYSIFNFVSSEKKRWIEVSNTAGIFFFLLHVSLSLIRPII